MSMPTALQARLEEVMLSEGSHTCYALAKKAGYSAHDHRAVIYNILRGGANVYYKHLSDFAESLNYVPIKFFDAKSGRPFFGNNKRRFQNPVSYKYFKSQYIADVFAGRRARCEITQSELASKVGLARNAISEFEHADATPTIANLESICGVLKMSCEFFVKPFGSPVKPPKYKPVSECLRELMAKYETRSNPTRLTTAVDDTASLAAKLAIDAINPTNNSLTKICSELRAAGIANVLPFVLWYYDSRTNTYRPETLGSDMLASGVLPEKYANSCVSRHIQLKNMTKRDLLRQLYSQSNLELTGQFTVSKLETISRGMGSVPQYFVPTIEMV